MTVSDEVRLLVRQRANFVCEYCGLREADIPDRLTVDHYQPSSKGGSDSLDNLVYSCIWCNQRKHAYWPASDDEIPLWNPRESTESEHFVFQSDGTVSPISAVGTFTIARLRLNRHALVEYRRRKDSVSEKDGLLNHYHELIALQNEVINQLTKQVEEQQKLLEEQQRLLNLLMRGNGGRK